MAETVCEKCGGSGWTIVEREGLSGAERCGCVYGTRARRLVDSANIPPLYKDASTENFLVNRGNPVAERALREVLLKVQMYTKEATDKGPGLLLIGDPGTGKTHLAVAALRKLIDKGFEGLFFDYQNLLDRIRAGFDPNSGASDREAYRTALETEILLLDDLGAYRAMDWVEDTVTSIITYRCNNRKTLIATTNLPDEEVVDSMLEGKRYKVSLAERIGARARSRLFEMCKVVRMPVVEDYRLRRSGVN